MLSMRRTARDGRSNLSSTRNGRESKLRGGLSPGLRNRQSLNPLFNARALAASAPL